MVRAVVGKDVDGWCARCKLVLAHTIEAVVGGKITRTHCNTCGAQHGHRPNAPGNADEPRAAAAKPRRSPAKKRTASASKRVVDYAAVLRGKDQRLARPYAMSEWFHPQELILHPTFGLGIVVAVRDARKIDVGFAEGVKTLAQGATAPA